MNTGSKISYNLCDLKKFTVVLDRSIVANYLEKNKSPKAVPVKKLNRRALRLNKQHGTSLERINLKNITKECRVTLDRKIVINYLEEQSIRKNSNLYFHIILNAAFIIVGDKGR